MNAISWIKQVKKYMKKIEEASPKDRLGYMSEIDRCNKAIFASTQGWEYWLSNPTIIDQFTKEELEEMLDEFRELALQFLRNDIKWTEHLLGKAQMSKLKSSSSSRRYIT